MAIAKPEFQIYLLYGTITDAVIKWIFKADV